jgi:hypothetical protein
MSDRGVSRPADLVSRLLGPRGPELTCEECFEHLDRYVELELAGRDADVAVPGMRAHLEGCPACHEDRDSLAALARSEPSRHREADFRVGPDRNESPSE